jgi:hypothetical protein
MHHSSFARLLPLAAAAVLACTTTTDFVANAGQALIGTWSSSNAIFSSSDAGATLRLPCVSAEFAPIVLDDTLGFSAVGVVDSVAGLTTVHKGDPWVISGRASGNQVVLDSPIIGTETLQLGSGSQPPVCTA